jgi:hypothetical protein
MACENMALSRPGAPEFGPAWFKASIAAMRGFIGHKQGRAYAAALQDFGDPFRFTPPACVNR